MTETGPLLHPGLAMDDIFDLWEMMEADIAAGRPVDARYHAAVKAEVARWDEDD